MMQTKRMTLTGSTLAVGSSTLLYVNMLLHIGFPGTLEPNPWLNIFVLGFNLDSILNDVGMLFVSGVLKNVSIGACLQKVKGLATAPPAAVTPLPLAFDSQAPSVYGPDEVGAAT